MYALLINPINWRPYVDFTKFDWVWLWLSNIGIVVLIGGAWWFGQRNLVRLIDGERARNQTPKRLDLNNFGSE